jgi:aminomethyltransferase
MNQMFQPKMKSGEIRIGLKPTPFIERLRPLNKFESLSFWQGYWAPADFGNAEREYFAIRNTSSVFDLSPMMKYRVTGPDAVEFFQRLMTRNIAKLKQGRVIYTVWCNDDGKVIDDGTLFRLGASEFRLCCQEHQLFWLLTSAAGFDVTIHDETDEVAGLSLQGPTSFSVLRALGLAGIETLKPFELRDFDFAQGRLMVSRTGFTGDLGYELWCAPQQALALWDALQEAGNNFGGVEPVGSTALDMTRIEAGFIGAHLDFMPADQAVRPGRAASPFELNLGWLVDFEKGHFTGRQALLREKQNGSPRLLVAVDIEGNKPAQHALIYHNKKKEAGHISSGIWSPTAKRNIGLAILDAPYGTRLTDDLWAEIYVMRELRWEKLMARCTIVKAPFFEPTRRRATPPQPF